jgi:hypothetical protein
VITVEDLVIKLATSGYISIQIYDFRVVSSFTNQLRSGQTLTEKQGSLAIKIIKKYHKFLSADTGIDILQFATNPIYKHPFRQPKSVKKISIIKSNQESIIGKIIKVEFPYDESYVELIREKRSDLGVAFWNKEEKAWLFSLSEKNIIFLANLMSKENFEVDEEFLNYTRQIKDIVDNIEQYIPTLSIVDGQMIYKNVSESVPPLESTEYIPAIFEARRRGISVWDDCIGKILESHENIVLQDFLVQDIGDAFYVDCAKHSIDCLKEIVQHLKPSIFIIPGGSELEKTTLAYNFLKNCGIQNENMSVMFRLPSDTGKDFNDFVKINNLNNPLTEKTEVVFISGKVPKPLMKSQVNFNCIINMGFDNPHYTSRNLVENHQNLIYYSEKPVQQRFLWQSLE